MRNEDTMRNNKSVKVDYKLNFDQNINSNLKLVT